MKKKTGKFLKSLIVMLGAAIISVVMCGCSSATTEEKLVGAWKKENSSETFLTIYDDGTYEQAHAYGTGRWTIVNGNVLKLTDFYGSSDTYELAEVSNDTIVLNNGRKWLKIGNI